MNERTANGNENDEKKSLIEKNHLSFSRCAALCDPNLFLNWSNLFSRSILFMSIMRAKKKNWKKNGEMCNMCKFSELEWTKKKLRKTKKISCDCFGWIKTFWELKLEQDSERQTMVAKKKLFLFKNPKH